MKKSIVTISLLLTAFLPGKACGPYTPTHNFYMMNVFGYEGPRSLFYDQVDDFWKAYTGREPEQYSDYFSNNSEMLLAAARQKGDREMTTYLNFLNQYTAICEKIKETWDYPTKEELEQHAATLTSMHIAAKAYKGKRLKPQYVLLEMRTNLLLGQAEQNLTVWKKRASRLPAGVFREMCRNLYANALLKAGRRQEAAAIYAGQGDWESISWLASGATSVEGIKAMYDEDADSPVLPYLLEHFVNSAQEEFDLQEQYDFTSDQTFKPHVDKFVVLAQSIIREGKTKSPALWQTAIAMLHYTQGKFSTALKEAAEAMKMEGPQRVKDNARCARLLAFTRCNKPAGKVGAFIAGELDWLWGRSSVNSAYEKNYYGRMLDRTMIQNLYKRYAEAGNANMQMALYALSGQVPGGEADNNPGHSNFGEYFAEMDSHKAEDLIAYWAFLQSTPTDAVGRFAVKHIVFKDKDYFNDLIGTKFIAEGRFADALSYLSKVPLSTVNGQGISFYMAGRDFTKDRWLQRQRLDDSELWGDTPRPDMKSNQKIAFCQDMIQLTSAYNLANAKSRPQAAYTLASRYFQSSCYGDCWYLTHYAWTCTDSARTQEKDFAQQALQLLGESALSKDARLRGKSLFAKAFVARSVGSSGQWYDLQPEGVLLNGEAEIKAYDELALFCRRKPKVMAPYVSCCDVLRRYMASK